MVDRRPGPGCGRGERGDATFTECGLPLAGPGPGTALARGLREQPPHPVVLALVEEPGTGCNSWPGRMYGCWATMRPATRAVL